MRSEVKESIDTLYARLSNRIFQEPQTGNLSIPYYLYCYEASQEYEVMGQIARLTNRLHRPDNYLEIPVIHIFDSFLGFLKEEVIGSESIYDAILRLEVEDPTEARDILTEQAGSEKFFDSVNDKIEAERKLLPGDAEHHPYIFLTGWAQIYPYLRSSRFLNFFERYNRTQYKLILFYPGKVERFCKLFNLLDDQHPYRINVLNPNDL